MDDKPHEDGTEERAESSGRTPYLSRRGMLAGTVGVGLLSSYAAGTGSGGSSAAAQDSEAPINIGSRLELFVDDYLIETAQGVESRLHNPTPEEVAIEFDEPWEGKWSAYPTVFRDTERGRNDSVYRMYYRAAGPGTGQQTAYAESEDGINWDKPDLGLYEYEGSTANNIVWNERPGAHNFTPFKDPNPDADPEARYKAVGGTGSLYAFKSRHGIEWSRMSDDPILDAEGAFDSQNTAFWDPVREEYRAYFRDFRSGRRIIETATSDDFLTWTDETALEYPEAPAEQLYTNGAKPYYRAPHIYLGFPARYVERDPDSESMRELPGWSLREPLIENSGRSGYALTDTLFMSSRDRETFNRASEAYIPPGHYKESSTANWFYGDNFPAWQLVELESPDPEKPRELSLYALENYRNGYSEDSPGASRLRRYSLRIDGFVSIHAPLSGGEFVTKPVIFDGTDLMVNYATSAAGSVRIELQNPAGEPYPGFSLSESPELFGDEIDRTVEYPNADVEDLAGRPVRLRFAMSDAHVYSFRFPDNTPPSAPTGEPLAHYPLDTIQSDGTVPDASGNGYDGTNHGAVIDDGIIDKAIRLHSKETDKNWVDTPTLPVEDTVSVAAWVNTEDISYSHQVFQSVKNDQPLYSLYMNGDKPTWWMATESGYELARNPSIPTGEWVHLAGTYDGGVLRLYVDGEQMASQSVPSDLLEPAPARIGADLRSDVDLNLQFAGRIDDMWIFDKALSQKQIQTLVNKG